MPISRRSFVVGLPFLLGGCATRRPPEIATRSSAGDPYYLAMYAAIDTEPFPVPAIDLKKVKPRFYRQQVSYRSEEKVGTIVVDPNDRFCYLVQEDGKAMRYGVGVGKIEAFNFRGEATIARKAEWPGWRPTPNMIAREPERYGPLEDGLPGGPGNPLGCRALYLHRDNQDTYYRLHGTVEPWTIGTQVSSGCIRLLNQDIIDLYSRVPIGAKAVVLSSGAVATG